MKKIILLTFVFVLLQIAANAQGQTLNYYTMGEGLTFTGGNDYKVNLRGYMQPMYDFKAFTDEDLDGVYQRFRMRRLRLRLSGDAAEQRVEYRLQVDFSGTSETGEDASEILFDAWIGYKITKDWTLTVGQKVTPTDNRELLIGSQTLQLVERSRVTSAFASIREFGFFLDGSYKLGNGHYIRPVFTLTNGDGKNVFTPDFGGFKVGGRVDYLPFGLFTNFGQFRGTDLVRELTPKLVVGTTYSYNKGMSSRRGRESGAILYLDKDGNYLLPDFSKTGIDFMLKYRGFTMLGEFVTTAAFVPDNITQRVRNDGSVTGNFEINGEQNVENYIKNRMMLGKGYNLQVGYIFKNLISIDARYTHLDADEYSFLNNGTFYNRPNYYTIGATKYFSKSYGFRLQASLTYVDASPGSNDLNGLPMNGNEWIGRLMATISF